MESILLYAALVYFFNGGTVDWFLWFILFFLISWWTIVKSSRVFLEKGAPAETAWTQSIPLPLWLHAIIVVLSFFPAYIFASGMEMIGLVQHVLP